MALLLTAGQLLRAAVELAKMWRQDKALRFLQAELLVADANTTLTVSGVTVLLLPTCSFGR
jgi:ATP-dependent HslUV protease subunit HslV